MKNKKIVKSGSVTMYQTAENCQVFNGPISGSTFSMTGSTVCQAPVQPVQAPGPDVQPVQAPGPDGQPVQAPGPDVQPVKSGVCLSQAKGMKIDFIRVMNALYELGFFQSGQGGRLTKKEFFTTIGQAVNVDLSNYDKDLSRSTADSTALEKHLRVFDDMRQKMTEIFNSK